MIKRQNYRHQAEEDALESLLYGPDIDD